MLGGPGLVQLRYRCVLGRSQESSTQVIKPCPSYSFPTRFYLKLHWKRCLYFQARLRKVWTRCIS